MIQSVQRAAQILAVLGSGTPRLGVTEIADRVGLAKPTVHGLLRTLEAHELVAQDPDTGKYSLGPGVLQLGNAYLDGSDLRARSLRNREPRRDERADRAGTSARDMRSSTWGTAIRIARNPIKSRSAACSMGSHKSSCKGIERRGPSRWRRTPGIGRRRSFRLRK